MASIMKKIKLTDLLIFVVTAELAGALSGLLSGGSFGEYYDTLIKPPLAPPGWVFPVVWAVLYAVMGISAYLIYSSGSDGAKNALVVYYIQLCINVLWTPLFFGLHSFTGGIVAAAALVLFVAAMIAVFYRICRFAALINIPYAVWTVFALYLSIGFAVLNT